MLRAPPAGAFGWLHHFLWEPKAIFLGLFQRVCKRTCSAFAPVHPSSWLAHAGCPMAGIQALHPCLSSRWGQQVPRRGRFRCHSQSPLNFFLGTSQKDSTTFCPLFYFPFLLRCALHHLPRSSSAYLVPSICSTFVMAARVVVSMQKLF
jgi:hypothetical protein